MSELPQAAGVLRLGECDRASFGALLRRFGMRIEWGEAGAEIPGSYWGESEAGLVGNVLHVRSDTPLHSALHEACHFICMDEERRAGLERDAGGEFEEENAVCYLQILLADAVPGFGRERMWRDMDAWGYTFRLGSARAWFEGDAAECAVWLRRHGVLDESGCVTGRVRENECARSAASPGG